MEQGINSDLPGELKALIAQNVYDTATGQYLLIPQGARLVGTYDSRVAYGKNGVQVVWDRIIFPDGSSIDLAGMPGQDAHGYSGLRQSVDNHYKRVFGFAALTSLFSAGFALSQSRSGSILQYPSVGETVGGAVGTEVTQLGTEITRRNLNVQPTIKIPAGYRFNVRVNRDILFDGPYQPASPADGHVAQH
jgi:type IV secretion system protein VirB10